MTYFINCIYSLLEIFKNRLNFLIHMNVTYGPHTFGNPLNYLRGGFGAAHDKLKLTLGRAFKEFELLEKLPGVENPEEINLNFINWGNVQIIYLATIDESKFAVSINQPHTALGNIKREYHNLQRLVEIDDRFVVKPHVYFTDHENELFVSDYVENARCIFAGSGYMHGMFDPLPRYHFETFSPEVSSNVYSAMIALLVRYHQDGKGIAKTQIAGDDFILTQDFEGDAIPHIKLISARSFVNCSLDEYVDMLKREFVQGTHYSKVSRGVKVNYKSSLPMPLEDIEKGIEMGMEMRR